MPNYKKFISLVDFQNGIMFSDKSYQNNAFTIDHKNKLDNLNDLLNRIQNLENTINYQQKILDFLFNYFFKSVPPNL
jgi:hypothetical protein